MGGLGPFSFAEPMALVQGWFSSLTCVSAGLSLTPPRQSLPLLSYRGQFNSAQRRGAARPARHRPTQNVLKSRGKCRQDPTVFVNNTMRKFPGEGGSGGKEARAIRSGFKRAFALGIPTTFFFYYYVSHLAYFSVAI